MILVVKYDGRSIRLWGCFDLAGNGKPATVNGKMDED